MDGSLVCARCGAVASADDPAVALAWVREGRAAGARGTDDTADRGAAPALAYCPRCSREHLRSIEAKLDQQYW